jgi:small subunit ribosomal protein S1
MTPRMPNPSGPDESFASLFEQTSGASRGRQRRYHTGETVEVTIVAIAREAVFADLGGKQEGMFERAMLADAEGKLRVELGSRVSAMVDSIDGGTGQVRLRPVVIRTADAGDVGVAHVGADKPALVVGARVKGKVAGVERYGVFVQIAGTQGRSGRGLVPTAETATPRGADLKKHFTVGQDVEAKILAIDETGKIRLSISALSADDERAMFEAFKSKSGQQGEAPAEGEGQPQAKGKAAPRKDKPEPRGFGTLGDVLSKGLAAAAKPAPAPAKAQPVKVEPARKPKR